MAKYCMNCGNKISYGNTAFEFTYSKGRMCSGCKKEAVDITNGLVMDLERLNKSDLTQDDAENIISEYMHRIEGSNYTTEVKECLRKEVESRGVDLVPNVTGKVVEVNMPMNEVIRKINSVTKELGRTVELVRDETLELGDTVTKVIVYDKYYMRVGGYASLTVALVSKENKTMITVIGAGGGEGMLNLDYGVADDFEDDFWKLFLGGEKTK